MIIRDVTLTDALAAWLRSRHDDGTEPLRVEQTGGDITITRADGSELSELETRHVRGTIAAHRVEPLKQGPRR